MVIKGFAVVIIIMSFALLIACSNTSSFESQEVSPNATVTSTLGTVVTPPTYASIPTLDTSTISSEQMIAMIWDELPDVLPQGYNKVNLHPETGNAIYQGGGKWKYTISGSVSSSSSLPFKYVERSSDYWVKQQRNKVITNEFLLQAEYYETTSDLDILSIEKTGETETTEIMSEVSVTAYKLKVNWISGSTTGYGFRVEGSVKNVGILTLENVLFVVDYYDSKDNFMGTENITLSPVTLVVGDSCKFVLNSTGFFLPSETRQGKVDFGHFTYRFLLPSGKEIEIEETD